ncbi:hypothetical protein HIM_01067 [Hirsutella minnesotensis 3608]|nr:hypothetical protein HIM_01067 [Hirsutella minnesotensis 3608]
MALPRESSFLPTIKCSLCGGQVEISMMGEHLCPGPGGEPSPPLESRSRFDDELSHPNYAQYSNSPPASDTDPASGLYMSRGQLTPVSQTGSRNNSPDGRLNKSPTNRYFPPSPTQSQPNSSYGGFGHSRKPSEEPGYAKQGGGGGFFDRINALARGPFETSTTSTTRSPTRANAFPARKDSLERWDGPPVEELSRTAAASRPDTSYSNLSGGGNPPPPPAKSPSNGQFNDGARKPMGPDRTRKPPPRTSLLGGRSHGMSPSVDLAAEFGVGNPYHTPSDSSSSGFSTFSELSNSTAQTSPARSFASRDKDMDDLRDSMEKMRSRDPAVQSPRRGASPARQPGSGYGMMRGNDPAVQYGMRDRGQDYQQLPSTVYNGPSLPVEPPRRNYGDEYPPAGRRRPEASSRGGSQDQTRSRGNCKSCGLGITGKSISSADGRLTGKYHKACFVCMTCREPFSSAEFYVLGDRPYCEQHYHKLNGSLCGGCGRGIEGQYVEDEARVKYHVGCFRCLDCGRSLSEGYFEVDGRAYCERDALRRTQPAPSSAAYGYGMADRDGYPPYDSRGMRSAPRGYGASGGSVRSDRRGGSGSSRGPPPPEGRYRNGNGSVRARPQMNKRMTRFGRI